MKFREVKLDDDSVLFYFCSILIKYKWGIFDFNNIARLIRTSR